GAFPGGLPTKEQLDAAVPDRPAYMDCYDGHSGWANSKALALAGITKDTPDPPRGHIVKDPRTGEPTGALKEAATALVDAKVPPPDEATRYALLRRALAQLAAQGVTAAQDAGYRPQELAKELPLLERALREGALRLRLEGSLQIGAADVDPPIAEGLRRAAGRRGPFLRFGTIKGYVDGVVEAHTAALLAPYADDPSLGSGQPDWDAAAPDAAGPPGAP